MSDPKIEPIVEEAVSFLLSHGKIEMASAMVELVKVYQMSSFIQEEVCKQIKSLKMTKNYFSHD